MFLQTVARGHAFVLSLMPDGGKGGGGGGVKAPNPAPKAPPGIGNTVDTILGWLKWGCGIAGVVGLGICGVMLMVGARNRSATAADGASHLPKVMAGLVLVVLAPHLVDTIL